MLGSVWSIVVATLLLASPAAAQPEQPGPAGTSSEDEARGHFLLGRSHFEAGRFAEAAEEFQRAYDISHRPELLYNVSLSHRDAGNLPGAIDALRRYLDEVPDVPNRAALEQRLRTMEELRAQHGDGAPPPADDGFDDTLPDPTAEPPQDTGQSAGPWVPGLIIAAGGAAMLVGSVITGVMALGVQSDLDDRCPMVGDVRMCTGEFADDRDRGETLALVTDVLLFGGLGVAALGAVLAFTVGGGDSATETGTESVACGPAGCTFTARF